MQGVGHLPSILERNGQTTAKSPQQTPHSLLLSASGQRQDRRISNCYNVLESKQHSNCAMAELEYTYEAARKLEDMYRTSDVIAQRYETCRLLKLCEGETVIDIGCGPGFLCEEIADAVGKSGRVLGIDVSEDFLTLAANRNRRSFLEYRFGDATAIDAPNQSFDVAVCTQVAEYVPDVDRVLTETSRVLRSGGRALFVATDWDTLVWHSDKPERMGAVLKSWEAHCAHPRLPRTLSQRLERAGFTVAEVSAFPIVNLSWSTSTYSEGLADLVRSFLAARNELPGDVLASWRDELEELSLAGNYFFSICRFVFLARRLE